MDIIDHITQLDKEHGSKLANLCINSNNYEGILEVYFGAKREIHRLLFDISGHYNNKLKHYLYHKIIDFDQYLIELANFLNFLYSCNLTPDKDGNYHIKNKLNISANIGKNNFVFHRKIPNLNIKITFSINQLEPTPSNLFRTINVRLDSIAVTIFKKGLKNYFYKTFSQRLPYILLSILILIITFSIFTKNIIDATKYLFGVNEYFNIAILLFIFCGFIIISPIYKVIESLREYFRIQLFFKIDKKYSNPERYINSLDYEQRKKMPLFDNRERAISTPTEDLFGFNLLSAFFYYNSIIDSFDSNLNLIIIIDAKRGMGKSSFINLILHRINGFTYRQENNCQLFKNILTNRQIKVVRFSIMPFWATLNNSDEKTYINNFISFIAENLMPATSKYLKAVLASITAFSNKFSFEKFINNITEDSSINKIKNKLRLSEQKNLIIIEDLDRLNSEQLKIAVKALWFIYDIPFTITLLPAEEEKIQEATNNNENNHYEEFEEYKLFQFAFPLKNTLYQLLANYTIKLYNETVTACSIDNAFIQLKKLSNDLSRQGKFSNAWVAHLYKNTQNNKIKFDRYLTENIENSIKNELVAIFDKYSISLREFKKIITKLIIGSNQLFIIQQILFYIIEYRYKYENGIIEYLNQYDIGFDFKKNRNLNLNPRRLKNFNFENVSSDIKGIILDLEQYPILNISDGISSFANSLFGFMNRSNRPFGEKIKLDKLNKQLFLSEFIKVFINNEGQHIYDKLSLNWHDNFSNLSISCSKEFVLEFNQRAEPTVSIDTNDHKFTYNLFLFQNFAILLLNIIQKDSEILNTLNNYFNGDKSYNYSISIYNSFYDVKVVFEIDIMVNYFRRLFNIDHNNFEYDKTKEILAKNYQKLKNNFVLDGAEPKFKEVFSMIFNIE